MASARIKPRPLRDACVEMENLTRIPAKHWEKDYYVTQALREIARRLDGLVLFKGGTSLSKAYNLIDRFSEDIDLLVTPDIDTVERVDEILDDITTAALDGIGPGAEIDRQELTPGFARKVWLRFPGQTPKSASVGKTILLEPGRRGGPLPAERRTIAPMLTGRLAGLDTPDFEAFDIAVLHPARTLLEKLFAVDALGAKMLANDGPVRGRQARHFYDIFYLLGDASPAIATLVDRTTVSDIVNDCREVSARWYGGDISDTVTCFADSSVFTRAELRARLESAYDQACQDLCYPGAGRPSWDEVLVQIESRRELLSVS